MATTTSNFVVLTSTVLEGAAVVAAPTIRAVEPNVADRMCGTGPGGTTNANFLLDRGLKTDLARAGYSKNGALVLSLSGTTPVDLSLADLTSNSTDSAGDTVFTKWFHLKFINLNPAGGGTFTIKQAASNPANLLGLSTTPALTVRNNGSFISLYSNAGETIDSTHKLVTITPSADGTMALVVGGQ